jgi:hypothetical protein
MSERDAGLGIDPDALIVRAPMPLGRGHAPSDGDQLTLTAPVGEVDEASPAAHRETA